MIRGEFQKWKHRKEGYRDVWGRRWRALKNISWVKSLATNPLIRVLAGVLDSCYGNILSITSIRMVSRSDRLPPEVGDWCVLRQILRLTIQRSGVSSCFCLAVRLEGRQLAGNTNISATHLISLNCDDCSCGVQWLHLLLSTKSYCSLL